LRTFILGLAAFVLVALGPKVGVGMLDAAAHSPSGLHGLRPSFDGTPLHLLPLQVTGLMQKAVDRPIGSTETAAVLGCILFEATVVGLVFQLALRDLGLGLILDGLVAFAGVWVVMLLYKLGSGAERSMISMRWSSARSSAQSRRRRRLSSSRPSPPPTPPPSSRGATHGRATR
jgi:hypothetical protein